MQHGDGELCQNGVIKKGRFENSVLTNQRSYSMWESVESNFNQKTIQMKPFHISYINVTQTKINNEKVSLSKIFLLRMILISQLYVQNQSNRKYSNLK
ncbi:unnamed protein product [Paramecium pentaurelia]|uniref:Uncharacterized protein n=1 Tax=Paramecium pentaurelia TaxID=43138 RepID=A0A8S1VE12_9CILI|nr:unnamed protein product [Paramecium pentaurelia]